MSSESRGRESDLAVMEANEFKQKRRLRSILDSREKVEEKADKAEELWIQGEISGVARQLIVLRAVREYIRETWQLLIEHADEAHDPDEPCEFLQRRVLGTIEFEHEEDDVVIRGLYDLLHCQETYTESWRELYKTMRQKQKVTQKRGRVDGRTTRVFAGVELLEDEFGPEDTAEDQGRLFD